MSDNAFCIDIGEKFIRIADAKLKGNSTVISTFGMSEATPSFYSGASEKIVEAQSEIISNLFNSLKIKKRNVNVVIPDSFSYSQIIEVPRLNDKELQSAIRYQADQFIPMPLDEISLDLEVISEDVKNKKNTVLLIATHKKIVGQIEKSLEYAGLNPVSLENEFSVIRRFYTEVTKPVAASSFLVVNIGYSTSSIYLIDQRSSLLIPRTIKVGLDLFIKDVKLNLGVDEKKALEILQNVGFEKNFSVNISPYIEAILKELINEINKFVILAKDKYGIVLGQIILFNHNLLIMSLDKQIQSFTSIPTLSLPLTNCSSAFASAVYGNIR